MTGDSIVSDRLDAALRWAATRHRDQTRKNSEVPYIQHPVAVAMAVDRVGFGDDVVIAGLLHDVVEDCGVALGEIESAFGPAVAELVAACSERKTDDRGVERSWIDRKRDYLDGLAGASAEARGVALADKLHNLLSIRVDLDAGIPAWDGFHAPRARVIEYYREAIARCDRGDDPRLGRLADECRGLLGSIEGSPDPAPGGPED